MASTAEIRAIKRSRYTRESYMDDPYETYGTLRRVPAGPHAPNSNEAHLLRRLKAQTGLTEEQLREHKCYRVQLSQAQKAKGSKTSIQRRALRLRKSITRELLLPKEHSQVKEAFLAQWPDYGLRIFAGTIVTAHDAWNSVARL